MKDDLYQREGYNDDDDYVCADHLNALQRERSPLAVGTWNYTLATGRECWLCVYMADRVMRYAPHPFLPVTLWMSRANDDRQHWMLFPTAGDAEDWLMSYDLRAPEYALIERSDPRLFDAD